MVNVQMTQISWEMTVCAHQRSLDPPALFLTSALYFLPLVQWQVNQDGGRVEKRFPPAKTFYCDN